MSKQKKEELHLDENELATWAERKIGNLKPYASQITLAIALCFAAFVAITYFVNARQSAYADQWRELSLANTDHLISGGNTARLLNVAEDYPNQKAAMWSLQIAGDSDLQTGLSQLNFDRDGGFEVIRRGRDHLQKVVDASMSIKSSELQQRALYSLAYAYESLGEFEQSRQYYQQLVDESPESAFADPARRGIERSNNPDLIALYDTFKNWKDVPEEAPGPNIPPMPNIDFPEDLDATQQPESGGGEFEGAASADAGEVEQETTTSTTVADEGQETPSDSDSESIAKEEDGDQKSEDENESKEGEGDG